MSELKCGDKVEIKEGDFKGAVGVIRKITEIAKTNVQIDFIGSRKTFSAEILQKIGSTNKDLTALLLPVEQQLQDG